MRGGSLEGGAASSHTQDTPSKTLLLNFSQVPPSLWGGTGLTEAETGHQVERILRSPRLIAQKSVLDLESPW